MLCRLSDGLVDGVVQAQLSFPHKPSTLPAPASPSSSPSTTGHCTQHQVASSVVAFLPTTAFVLAVLLWLWPRTVPMFMLASGHSSKLACTCSCTRVAAPESTRLPPRAEAIPAQVTTGTSCATLLQTMFSCHPCRQRPVHGWILGGVRRRWLCDDQRGRAHHHSRCQSPAFVAKGAVDAHGTSVSSQRRGRHRRNGLSRA